MRCVGGGVIMPSFSEAPASIALMWICGAPTGGQSKSHSLYFKKCTRPTSLARRVRVLLHFSYLISHISYSHSHNLLLSYLVSHIWGGSLRGGTVVPTTKSC